MHGEPFHEFDVRQSAKDGFDGGVEVNDELFGRRHAAPEELLAHMARHHRGREVVGFKLFQKHLPARRGVRGFHRLHESTSDAS